MRWIVNLGGTHEEGPECRERFEGVVGEFVEKLGNNGFALQWSCVDHADSSMSFAVLPHLEDGYEAEPDAGVDLAVSHPIEVEPSEPGPAETLAASLSVDFASAQAGELADELDLTDRDFEGVTPSGKTGYTVGDVRGVAKAK